jgi:hypothetical protein
MDERKTLKRSQSLPPLSTLKSLLQEELVWKTKGVWFSLASLQKLQGNNLDCVKSVTAHWTANLLCIFLFFHQCYGLSVSPVVHAFLNAAVSGMRPMGRSSGLGSRVLLNGFIPFLWKWNCYCRSSATISLFYTCLFTHPSFFHHELKQYKALTGSWAGVGTRLLVIPVLKTMSQKNLFSL